jgi:hypothetical protein
MLVVICAATFRLMKFVPSSKRFLKSSAGNTRLNPVNLPPRGGVQLELPPRIRGTSPLFWDWEGPELNPHSQALVDALALSALTFEG